MKDRLSLCAYLYINIFITGTYLGSLPSEVQLGEYWGKGLLSGSLPVVECSPRETHSDVILGSGKGLVVSQDFLIQIDPFYLGWTCFYAFSICIIFIYFDLFYCELKFCQSPGYTT